MLVLIFGVVPAADFLNRWITRISQLCLSGFRGGRWQSVSSSMSGWLISVRTGCTGWCTRVTCGGHISGITLQPYAYWLAGIRVSVVELTIQNLPYIAAGAFLALSPWWIFWALLLKATFQNDFMHLNMRLGNRWLEWIIVTPRYHHIHHSDNPEHYNNNLAVLFPIWDHLFGTYLDPDKVSRNLTFGIGESVPAVRLAIVRPSEHHRSTTTALIHSSANRSSPT